MTTVNGPVNIDAPHDRNESFEAAMLPKKTRRPNTINPLRCSSMQIVHAASRPITTASADAVRAAAADETAAHDMGEISCESGEHRHRCCRDICEHPAVHRSLLLLPLHRDGKEARILRLPL
ncbi:hypothetical protein DQP55_23205 [Mycolicibacterium sp. GF69]|uniref:hypothetical protein n=1 Tax=Mycolicibacterium sp. GF69 TaxID=2267251 RepID=UPI000DCB9112|nr:hypothetical protein DQP55_23205 [Mycolicibacterium sp. GF69]